MTSHDNDPTEEVNFPSQETKVSPEVATSSSPNSGDSVTDGAEGKTKPWVVVLSIALIAAVVLAIAYFALKKDSPTPTTTSSPVSTADTPGTDSSHNADSGASTPQADPVAQQEEEIAAKHGWTVNKDFVGSQGERARELISTITNFASDSGRAYGSDNAPVTIHLYTDFSCPICAQFERENLPKFKELADQGDVRIVWHNFTIFASDYSSDLPARASLAAARQGKLWEYAQAVYANLGDPQGHPSYTNEGIIEEARKLGLDMVTFEKDYKDPAIAAEVETEYKNATKLGLSGTPTIFIGNAYLSGNLPFEILSKTITVQKELAQQQG